MASQNIEIHETAFVTATFRAMNETLSADVYAKLWRTAKTEEWINEYLKEVSSEEVNTHCLRNRFFLEAIKNSQVDVLINFGSGFSMYPFLLSEEMIHIEIDKPEIVNYKQQKVEEWQKSGVLPRRNIHFVGVDFSKDYEASVALKIKNIVEGKSCFILIEGVLFFLNMKQTQQLFSFFNALQSKGDFIGSASFQGTLKTTTAFKNLLEFFNKKVGKSSADDWLTVEDEFYTSLKKYELIDHKDYFSMSEKHQHKIASKRDEILNENFYLLKKKS